MSNPRRLDTTDSTNSSSGYIQGDYDPKNFDYKVPLSRQELLILFLRNPKIQKATVWFASEVLRERWEFKTDQPITAPKFGIDYTFEKFTQWMEWNGSIQEIGKALTWSLLFGEAILVFYDGNEQEAKMYKDGNKLWLNDLAEGGAMKCKAFYEECKGNGYLIEEIDNFFGIPTVYRITLRAHKTTDNVVYYVDASRVVRFAAPQKELKYNGASTVTTIAHDCVVQEQIKRAVATQANMLQSGILAVKASNEDEKDLIDAEIGDSFSYLRRVYYTDSEEIDKLFKLIVPDLKIEQMVKLFETLQKDIATGMDMSISNLEGAPQGALSSAEYDTLNTYAKVKQLQSHYTRALEETFNKFGKLDTTFEWGDPSPKAPEVKEPTKEEDAPEDKEPNKEEDAPEDKENEDEETSEEPGKPLP